MTNSTQNAIDTLFANYAKTLEKTVKMVEKVENPLLDKLNSSEFIRFNLNRISNLEENITSYYLAILDRMESEGISWDKKTEYLQTVVFKDIYPLKKSGKPVGYATVKNNVKKDYSAEQVRAGHMINRFNSWTGKYYSGYGIEKDLTLAETSPKTGNKGKGKEKEKESKNGKVFKLKEVLTFLGGLLENEENEEIVESFNTLAVHFDQEDLAI